MKTKTYKLEFFQDEDNKLHTKRENKGFNAFEILGMIEHTKNQIIKLICGEITIPIENTKLKYIGNDRVTIDHVINTKNISNRLSNALKNYSDYFGVLYFDEVDEKLMAKKIRGYGAISDKELKEIKEELFNK